MKLTLQQQINRMESCLTAQFWHFMMHPEEEPNRIHMITHKHKQTQEEIKKNEKEG